MSEPAEPSVADQLSPSPLAPGLYLVATPIGNLEDLTLRALRTLRSADRIACEDTRQTAKLLNHFGIQRPVVSYHLHNERERSEELIADLQKGARIAVVSDAGMPGIADPGGMLVQAAVDAGIPVFPVPGANAALSALVAGGLPTERFTFHGFLPAKEGQRRTELERLRSLLGQTDSTHAATHIFYEAPHRILDTLTDLVAVFGPDQRVVLARELTKLHEEFLRGTAGEVLGRLKDRASVRGELVLLLDGRLATSPAGGTGASRGSLAAEVAAAMAEGLSEKDALKQAARTRGLGKSEAYREWQRTKR